MNEGSRSSSRKPIESITGEALSGVAFVQDYVEFQFDGMIVRSLTMPVVATDNARYLFPEPGSRDALCALIGAVVQSVMVREGREIEISMSGGSKVKIPLVANENSGPEAAHFVSGLNQPIDVWLVNPS